MSEAGGVDRQRSLTQTCGNQEEPDTQTCAVSAVCARVPPGGLVLGSSPFWGRTRAGQTSAGIAFALELVKPSVRGLHLCARFSSPLPGKGACDLFVGEAQSVRGSRGQEGLGKQAGAPGPILCVV